MLSYGGNAMSSHSIETIRFTVLGCLASGLCLALSGCGESSEEQSPSAPDSPDVEVQVEPAAPTRPTLQFAIDQPVTAEGFGLEWAVWGDKACTQVVDATEFVQHALTTTGLLASKAKELNAAIGDPRPGQVKWLTAALRTPTGTMLIGLTDSSRVYLTTPAAWLSPWDSKGNWPDAEIVRANELLASGPRSDINIVWTRWGSDGKTGGWITANEAVDAQLADGGTVFNRPQNMKVAKRPNKHKSETLRLLMAIGGQPVGVHLRGNSYISTTPLNAEIVRPETMRTGPGGIRAPYITSILEGVGDAKIALPAGDGQHIYLRDAGTRLLKVDCTSLAITNEINNIDRIYGAMALSPDGRTLYLGGPTNGFDKNRARADSRGMLAQVDLEQFTLGQAKVVRCDIKSLTDTGKGNLIAINGSGGSGRYLEMIDPASGVMAGERGIDSLDQSVVLHPDGQRLYLNDDGRITCLMLDSFTDPRANRAANSDSAGAVRVRGHFTFINDAQYIVTHEGALARLSNNYHRAFLGIAKLPQNSGAVLSRDLGLLVVAIQDGIQVLSWPSLKPLGEFPNQGVLVDLSLDSSGRIMCARWMPKGSLRKTRPPASEPAKLVSFDLEELTPAGYTPEPTDIIAHDDAHDAIVRRLPLQTDIAGLVMPFDGKSLYALDAAGGEVLRLDTATLDVVARSAPLPYSTNEIAVDRYGKWLAVASTPAPYDTNKENAGGVVLVLDPETLAVNLKIDVPVDPLELAVSSGGRLYVASGSNQWTQIIEYDIATGVELGQHGSYMGASICVGPIGKALFISTRRLSPGSVEGLQITDSLSDAKGIKEGPLNDVPGGTQIWISSDGNYIASMMGSVFRVPGRTGSGELTGLGSVDEICGGASDGRLLITCDALNRLTLYKLPSLKPTRQILLDGTLTELCYDANSQRLYGALRPGGKYEGHEQFSGALLGDVVTIDLAAP